MDSTWTVGEVAALLGVTATTVLRGAARLGLRPVRTEGGHRRFTEHDIRTVLVPHFGIVPHVAGHSREATLVLAGLSRRPLGLRSARAVARASRVSPTTASEVLPGLVEHGLVTLTRRRVVEGVARDIDVFEIAWAAPGWRKIAAVIGRVVLPSGSAPSLPERVPRRLAHLFWNADLHAVDPGSDGDFVAGRLLLSEDPQGVAWAVGHMPAEALASAGNLRHASVSQRALARNAASST